MIELVEDKDNKSYMLNGKKYTPYVLKNNEWRWYRKKWYMENQSELLEMEIWPLK